MTETLKTLAALTLLFVALPIVILLIADVLRYKKRRITAEEREAGRKAWIDRLRQPRFEEVEKICGGAVPKRLRLAFEQGEVILRKEVEFTATDGDSKEHFYWIAEFVPLDREGQTHSTDLTAFGRGCCFAADGCGNFYWTPVSDKQQDDAPVFFACHDPYGNEKVADSLEQFFSRLATNVRPSKS